MAQEKKELEEKKIDEKDKSDALEWIGCFIIAIVCVLLMRFFIGSPTVVHQRSMYPTLQENERLWLSRWGRTIKKLPERGDIITFEAPDVDNPMLSEIDMNNPVASFNQVDGVFDEFVYYFLEVGKISYIKRVIALPGEHVEIKDGVVYINGEKLEEDYLQDGVITEARTYSDFIVPENCVFALGDNRTESKDCRNFGCIPLEKIEGVAQIRFWPFGDRFGKIDK